MRRNINWVWLFLSLVKDNLGFGVLFLVFCFSLSLFCLSSVWKNDASISDLAKLKTKKALPSFLLIDLFVPYTWSTLYVGLIIFLK